MKEVPSPVADNAQVTGDASDGPFAPLSETGNIRETRGRWIMGLPVIDNDIPPEELDRMAESATEASNFLKAISHEGRLMILCHLCTGEKSVTDLENLLSTRQAAVSQQLARLRLEGLVAHRREGKTIYYSLKDGRARRVIELLYEMFCGPDCPARQS